VQVQVQLATDVLMMCLDAKEVMVISDGAHGIQRAPADFLLNKKATSILNWSDAFAYASDAATKIVQGEKE